MKKFFLSIVVTMCFSVTFVSGQSNTTGSGISMAFNGNTNNYVDLGDTYNSLTFPYTIEAWVKMNSYLPVTSFVFSSDNSPSAYTGVGMHIHPGGAIDFYFSSNTGGGPGDRGGVISTSVVPLNQWTHVAGVAYSAFDLRIYINGVQSNATFSGEATTIASNSSHGFIGRRIDPYNTLSFDGQIDEVRLWDVARSQENIRNFMCRKLDPSTSGLIGYWTADESYTSNTVNDNTTPAENGTVAGTLNKLTSGAPIGDASKKLYTSTWSGQKVALTSPSGDKFVVKAITGSPSGVQVYRVDAAPFDEGGLNVTPSYYYGVFCAELNDTAAYKVLYKYSTSNGVINSGNESTAGLMKRNDGSVTTWTDLNALLDTSKNQLSKNNQNTRKEYILNLTPHGKLSASDQTASSSLSLSIYPNPAAEIITFSFPDDVESISIIRITDITGKVLQEIEVKSSDRTVSMDVSHFKNGSYIVSASTSTGWKGGKFEVQK